MCVCVCVVCVPVYVFTLFPFQPLLFHFNISRTAIVEDPSNTSPQSSSMQTHMDDVGDVLVCTYVYSCNTDLCTYVYSCNTDLCTYVVVG